MKAYIAHAMTGRSGADMLHESFEARRILAYYGISTLDPVLDEGITKDVKVLTTTVENATKFWKRDKAMIREAHVVIDLTPHIKSEGVSHEIGYGRYFLWKPVARVGTFPPASIAVFEDDVIGANLFEVGEQLEKRFGTRSKRLRWRLTLYLRCWLRACWYKLSEWVR